MRLSKQNAFAFIKSIQEMGVVDFELYLFGSRAEDHLSGGDIDLLIIANQDVITLLQEQKALLLAKMKMKTEDERIDITFIAKETRDNNEFYKTLSQGNLIRLNN